MKKKNKVARKVLKFNIPASSELRKTIRQIAKEANAPKKGFSWNDKPIGSFA